MMIDPNHYCMKKLRSLIPAIVFLLTNALYGVLPSSIVIFGDSLSDTGNVGRYTNGQLWTEVFAQKLHLPDLQCSKLGGCNFAYAGAKSGENIASDVLDVGNQIKAYLDLHEGKADPLALYVIWIGGNDFLDKRNPLKLISNIRSHIEALVNAGGKKFLVPNLPSLIHAPRGEDMIQGIVDASLKYSHASLQGLIFTIVKKLMHATIYFYNVKLNQMLKTVELSKNINVYRLDTFKLFNEMFEELEIHGFKDKSELFYDPLHPSAKVHALIATSAYKALEKP